MGKYVNLVEGAGQEVYVVWTEDQIRGKKTINVHGVYKKENEAAGHANAINADYDSTGATEIATYSAGPMLNAFKGLGY